MPKKDFRAIVLPYCLQKIKDGSYIILNRNYKPIGFNTNEHLRYEDYPICHRIKGINRKTAISLSYNNSNDIEKIYLYSNDCIPTNSTDNMEKYLHKIATIAKYKLHC